MLLCTCILSIHPILTIYKTLKTSELTRDQSATLEFYEKESLYCECGESGNSLMLSHQHTPQLPRNLLLNPPSDQITVSEKIRKLFRGEERQRKLIFMLPCHSDYKRKSQASQAQWIPVNFSRSGTAFVQRRPLNFFRTTQAILIHPFLHPSMHP